MERQAKYQEKILKFLPKPASSSVSFHQKLPFSPSKDNNKRFSGMVPMIPHEARIRRRKTKNNNNNTNGFESPRDEELSDNQDPTSPKISCMGQIKHKTAKKKRVVVAAAEAKEPKPGITWSPREVKKQASALKRMLSSVVAKPGRKSSASASSLSLVDHHDHDLDRDCDRYSVSLSDKAPSLSQMKRFASGRDCRLASFDWAEVQVAPVDADHRNIHDDNEVKIPFSTPLGIINSADNDNDNNPILLNPRKEINLWKRRTMAPPRPLNLNTMAVRAK